MSNPEKGNLPVDINFEAYKVALNSGDFANFEPGTIVVFNEGKLIALGTDRNSLLADLQQKGYIGVFFHEVGDDEVIDIPTPFIDE